MTLLTTKETDMKIVTEIAVNEGLESLMNQDITLFCMNYIYTGKLVGINDTQVCV